MDPSLPPTSTEINSRGRPPPPRGPRTPLTRSASSPTPAVDDHDDGANQGVWAPASLSPLQDKPTVWKMPSLPHIDPLSRPAAQPATLTPPSPLSFDTPPLPFKGMPLSAAEWTLTSTELQEIVSRAIRLSSRESYIRLLSVRTIDEVLPQEIARLNTLKMVTQAKYKFQVHRRTMLFQALNSISLNNVRPSTPPPLPPDDDAGEHQTPESPVSVISKLTSQLSETTAAMDLLAADLVTIATHQAQISALASTHWGSALAIALRKINSSFAKRAQELKDAGQRIAMLEAEVAEAWSEADRLAGEMDALEKYADAIPIVREPRKDPDLPEDVDRDGDSSDQHHDPDADLTGKLTVRADGEDMTDLYHYAGEATIETANIVSVPRSLRALSEPTTPMFDPPATHRPERLSSPIPNPRPMSLTLPAFLPRKQSMDAISAISAHSAPSTASRRARVSAARKRSSRASLASLRLPAHSRKGSRAGGSHGHGTPPLPVKDKQLPPLPTLSASWAAVSKALPRIQRRRSDQDVGPTLQPPPAQRDGIEMEAVPKEEPVGESFLNFLTDRLSDGDSEVIPVSTSLDLPPIPSVWLNPDGPRHSVLRPSASANGAIVLPKTQEGSESTTTSPTTTRLSRSLSASTREKIRTLIRQRSESILGRARFTIKRDTQTQSTPASELLSDPEDADEDADQVPQTIFAPNPSGAPTRVVTGSRFFESPSICSPGTEPPSAPRAQRTMGTTRSTSGSRLSRLGRFKTMTMKYSLALHPFGVKKVEAR